MREKEKGGGRERETIIESKTGHSINRINKFTDRVICDFAYYENVRVRILQLRCFEHN